MIRAALPVDDKLPELAAALDSCGVVVLLAEPGAGKTTRVPPFLALRNEERRAQKGPGAGGRVLVLEPRRVAARAAASRMAQEDSSEVGQRFGYQVRLEKRWGADSRVVVLTEGLLLRFLQNDPELSGVATVVLDEFHERSRYADLCLALLKEMRRELRPDLEIVVMSATLDAAAISIYLDEAPIVVTPGRQFPVESTWLGGNAVMGRLSGKKIADRMSEVLRGWLPDLDPSDRGENGVLAFLPGAGEINQCLGALAGVAESAGVELHALHGSLSLDRQLRATKPSARTKIVLASNVAETSLTVAGISCVIDSGYERRLSFDAGLGLDRLELTRISKSSATQRAGRAGRTGPGRCMKLWTRQDEAGMELFTPPDVRRIDLAELVLEVLAWGCSDPEAFDWFETPPAESLAAAVNQLLALGAIRGKNGRWLLSDVGREIAKLGMVPRLGRLLIEANREGALQSGARLVTLLSERDLFRQHRHQSHHRQQHKLPSVTLESDLADRLIWLETAPGSELDPRRRREILRRSEQLESRLRTRKPSDATRRTPPRDSRRKTTKDGDSNEWAWLAPALLSAWPDRVAKRRQVRSPEAIMVGGRGLKLEPGSKVVDAELFIAVELSAGARGAQSVSPVRLASAIEREDLERVVPEALATVDVCYFDEAKERVKSRREWRYQDLVLETRDAGTPDPEEAATVLAEAFRRQPHRVLEKLEEAEFQTLRLRLELLAGARPELKIVPIEEARLIDYIAACTPGCRSFADLRKLSLAAMIRAELNPLQAKALATEMPQSVVLPNGRSLKIRYEPGQEPTIAARVQHLFGLWQAPRLAQGRIDLRIEILAPNQRPVQVTTDLESFWTSTYRQVRKDLRGRYPKHDWPETPPPPVTLG
ncbi:MAG: ATP-dependent helicase HrpB [Planctomycetota bacterium]